MNGARFVHDQLERGGWQVEIAAAQKVRGLAPLACKTDRIDARVGAGPLPAPPRPPPRQLKQRVHAILLAHGVPCPVSDLFGRGGRQLLARLALPEPWQASVRASLRLLEELEREIAACEAELRRLGADHRYLPPLLTVPGIGWVLA
jgi:transposase